MKHKISIIMKHKISIYCYYIKN